MSIEDFDFSIQLTDTMGWHLGEEDFEFVTELEPDGCFVLYDASKRIGIATTIGYDKIGWLGNVIVSERFRGRGAGTVLVKHCIDYLTSIGLETVGLYAYPERVPFYQRLGFESSSKFIILMGNGFSGPGKAYPEVSEDEIPEVINLDGRCFGSKRSKLLKPLLLDSSNMSFRYLDEGEIQGFVLTKIYGDTAEIGPLVCKKGYTRSALDLIKCSLNSLQDIKVSICIPEQESEIYEVLTKLGFVEHFRVVRMLRGKQIDQDCIYAAESLERG